MTSARAYVSCSLCACVGLGGEGPLSIWVTLQDAVMIPVRLLNSDCLNMLGLDPVFAVPVIASLSLPAFDTFAITCLYYCSFP